MLCEHFRQAVQSADSKGMKPYSIRKQLDVLHIDRHFNSSKRNTFRENL